MRESVDYEKLLHDLAFLPKRRPGLFRSVPVNERGFVLLDLSDRVREQVVADLSDEEISSLLHYVDLYQAARILRSVSPGRRRRITKGLKEHIRERVDFLTRFQPGTAAGVMSLDYIELEIAVSFVSAVKAVKEYEETRGRAPALLAVQDGFLVGEVPLRAVLTSEPEEPVAPKTRRIPSVRYDASARQVLKIFRDNPRSKIVVLDNDRSIIGVIYSDDILRLIDEGANKELYGFAGVRRDEDVFDSVTRKVRNRYVWLVVNLGTAFLAALTVGLFRGTISKMALLAAYMPVVAGMGGNAATQTLAVVVRGLVSRKISRRSAFLIAFRESLAGALNGVITGGIFVLIMIVLKEPPILGFVVAVSIFINLIIAGFFGTITPLVLRRLGRDPASSASIFITTATDVFGFLVFLGLARIFLV